MGSRVEVSAEEEEVRSNQQNWQKENGHLHVSEDGHKLFRVPAEDLFPEEDCFVGLLSCQDFARAAECTELLLCRWRRSSIPEYRWLCKAWNRQFQVLRCQALSCLDWLSFPAWCSESWSSLACCLG